MSRRERGVNGASGEPAPLKSHRVILEQEIELAEEELERPTVGLLLSGLAAGLVIGTSVLLVAALLTLAGGEVNTPGTAALLATGYAVGFVVVILGRLDLFTEYTTIAILPVLNRRSSLGRLGRFWALIYASNLAGATLIAAFLAALGPRIRVIDPSAFGAIARNIVEYDALGTFATAGLAGWLMGLLAWLVVAARSTTGQIFFIWWITATIWIVHLPHSVIGTVEVLAGTFAVGAASLREFAGFLFWTTLGNAVGGVLFAVLIRYSTVGAGGRADG